MAIQASDYISLNRGGTPGNGSSGTYYVALVSDLSAVLGTAILNAASLGDIGDVNVAGATDKQVLKWDAGTGKWVAATDNAITSGTMQADKKTLRLTDAEGNNVDTDISSVNPVFDNSGTSITATDMNAAIAEAAAAMPSDASETAKGIAEIATSAEATAGTDDLRIMTPKKVKEVVDAATGGLGSGDVTGGANVGTGADVFKQENASHVLEMRGINGTGAISAAVNGDNVDVSVASATTTAEGVVELATNAEATAGTDTTRAVTPAGVAAAMGAAGLGDVTGGANVGTGADVFKQENASHELEMRGIHGVAPITAAVNGDNIDVDIADATTAGAGAVELATNAETTAGTDTVRATTPAGVKAALDARPPCLTTDLGGTVPAGPEPRMWIDDTAGSERLMVWGCAAGAYIPFNKASAGSQNVVHGAGAVTDQTATENTAITDYTTPSNLFSWDNGGTISLSATGLPPGITFTDNGNGTGTFSGTPTTAGSYTTTITATANDGSTATDSNLDWTVSAAAVHPPAQTFSPAATCQDYTVPAGVNTITATLKGSGGGGGSGTGTGNGGNGGLVTATFPVTAGEVLKMCVPGDSSVSNQPSTWDRAGGGGGYAAILRGSTPIVVAGGGGGGSSGAAAGGDGGGLVGAPGEDGADGVGGGGGTQSAGGTGGNGAGSSLQGGDGGDTTSKTSGHLFGGGPTDVGEYAGGGGGGGYFGGGGGGGDQPNKLTGGGGGGSSYTDASCTNVSHVQGGGGAGGAGTAGGAGSNGEAGSISIS